MKLTLSRTEMLRLRRMSAGLEPLRNDCSIEITDGIDLDEALARQMRAWYLNLLDTGPRQWIAPEDIFAEAAVYPGADSGSLVSLPSCCRRAFEIRLQEWAVAVPVLPAERLPEVLNRQRNPFTAATASSPVAVAAMLGDGRQEILAWPPGGEVVLLTAATDRGEDVYTFDEAAMATWPTVLPDFES